ncbi:mitochondrial import protein Pam17 [Lophiostoma macrostomum CBS 122681]|uniref:Presequence translocated-associated motor subunit PAM17 n=1 Tax=Lophiostoma macrostomum CBS 122681 TaxID=1314788 RepID=A0A6A6SWG2_9PLEO|nr:mitochondrial import protein Pam17 [Lophiostoma macrostomum CBS 122681]
MQRTQHPFFASKPPAPCTLASVQVRSASTADSASTTGQPSPNPANNSPDGPLTWNRFLTLRRTRRKISVVTSSISAVATTYVGLRAFITYGYDTTLSASLGLDPIVVTGLSTFGFLAAGWLIGPFFGNAVFNAWYRNIKGDILEKERQFYTRIKLHRVDPTSSSMANPVPDYYGEKIGSVADYRRWLKDQRAFNLKRGAYQGNK